MKRLLLSLLLLAGFAAANTCTEAWFEVNNYTFFISENTPRLDSVYHSSRNTFVKPTYENGHIVKLVNGYIYGSESYNHTIDTIIWSKDENILSNTGYESLFSDFSFNDTIYLETKHYYNGQHNQTVYYKMSSSYSSSLSVVEDFYLKGSKFLWEEFTELFFRNDTLIQRDTTNYSPDGSPTNHITFYVEDPEDDYKCYEYHNNTLTGTLTYQKNERGYSIKYFNQDILDEYFMVYPSAATTAIRKQRPAVKISPKARYFDLLGRYKFTK